MPTFYNTSLCFGGNKEDIIYSAHIMALLYTLDSTAGFFQPPILFCYKENKNLYSLHVC